MSYLECKTWCFNFSFPQSRPPHTHSNRHTGPGREPASSRACITQPPFHVTSCFDHFYLLWLRTGQYPIWWRLKFLPTGILPKDFSGWCKADGWSEEGLLTFRSHIAWRELQSYTYKELSSPIFQMWVSESVSEWGIGNTRPNFHFLSDYTTQTKYFQHEHHLCNLCSTS